MGDGFYVETDALSKASRGIRETTRDMASFKVEDLPGPEEMYGSGQLRDAFEHFCDRWQTGIEILVKDSDQIATTLSDAAALYTTMDETGADAIGGRGVVGSGNA